MKTTRVSIAVAAALLVSPPLFAQTAGRPVALLFGAGLSATSSTSGAALGGTLTFDLTERVVFETTGSFLDRGPGMDAIHLSAGLQLNLLPPGKRAVPYAAAAAGVYRASFDMDHDRMFGRLGRDFGPGMQMVPLGGQGGWGMMQNYHGQYWTGTWNGPVATAQQMPMFYQQRVGTLNMTPDGRWGRRSFTDPALTLGGGLRLALTEAIEVKPDARALLVFANGDTHTVGVFSFAVGYRF